MSNANAVQQDNAGKLRPFDATKCKPGDPVVRVQNGYAKHARFVAYVEDAIPDYRAIILEEDGRCNAFTVDGRYMLSADPEVFLPPLDPLDEVDPSPGNIDKLTRRQVGEGYRIPTHDEVAPGGEDIWLPESRYWKKRTANGGDPYCRGSTYRVPVAPAMVALEQSDIVLGMTIVRMPHTTRCDLIVGTSDFGVFTPAGETAIPWDALRDRLISFDHGVTWQKAEKKGKETAR